MSESLSNRGFMEVVTSQIIPINRSHIDTDLIIPAEYLRVSSKVGFGEHLFAGLRKLDKEFPLNLEKYRGAKIMLTRENFGCGSSREHAAWSLSDYGIKVIIAISFADIFYQNAFNNQILPIALPHEVIDAIFLEELHQYPYVVSVDLIHQTITLPSGNILTFTIDPFRKECFVHGMDDFKYLLSKKEQIKAFENRHKKNLYIDTYLAYQLLNK